MWGTKAPHVNVGKNVCLHNQHFPNASSASKMYVGKLAYIKCSRKHRGNATVWFGKLQIAKVRRQQKKERVFASAQTVCLGYSLRRWIPQAAKKNAAALWAKDSSPPRHVSNTQSAKISGCVVSWKYFEHMARASSF